MWFHTSIRRPKRFIRIIKTNWLLLVFRQIILDNRNREPTKISIASVRANYGVSFPMAAKVSVKGEDIAPIFKFLTEKKLNGVKDTDIAWNFTKFLLDDKGKLINSFPSKVKPTDEAIVKYLK